MKEIIMWATLVLCSNLWIIAGYFLAKSDPSKGSFMMKVGIVLAVLSLVSCL